MTALRGMYIISYSVRITGDVRQEPCQDIPTKHALSKSLNVLFSEAYHFEVACVVLCRSRDSRGQRLLN